MKKLLSFLSVSIVLFLALTCLSAGAATVTGQLLDQGTGTGVKAGSVTIYVYNTDTTNWDGAGWTSVDPADPLFTFSDLAAGTYIFYFAAPGYIAEYYNNTTVYDNKTEVVLTASQTKNLGKVYLKALPVRFSNCQLTPGTVPATGGTVTISCDVLNDGATAKKVLVWPCLKATRSLYNSTYTADSFSLAAKWVTVAAASSESVSFSVTVPGNAPSNAYIAEVYMNCGANRWLPLVPEWYVGSILKAAP